jgi:hypothetical protein
MYLLEIIGSQGNKIKRATFPYPTFLRRSVLRQLYAFFLKSNGVKVSIQLFNAVTAGFGR